MFCIYIERGRSHHDTTTAYYDRTSYEKTATLKQANRHRHYRPLRVLRREES